MSYNKDQLKTQIKELEACIKMEAHIRETVKKFRHRKQVNQTFIDALKKDETIHAYICKDTYSSKLRIYPLGLGNNTQDFTIYHSEILEKRPFTWQEIESVLDRYDYAKRLADAKRKLEVFDTELEKLKAFQNEFLTIEKELSCFDLYQIRSKLEDIINHATEKAR